MGTDNSGDIADRFSIFYRGAAKFHDQHAANLAGSGMGLGIGREKKSPGLAKAGKILLHFLTFLILALYFPPMGPNYCASNLIH